MHAGDAIDESMAIFLRPRAISHRAFLPTVTEHEGPAMTLNLSHVIAPARQRLSIPATNTYPTVNTPLVCEH